MLKLRLLKIPKATYSFLGKVSLKTISRPDAIPIDL